AQYAHTGTVGLFRMLYAIQYLEDIKPHIFMNGCCPFQEPVRCPFGYKAVRSGQMVLIRGIAVGAFDAFVHRNSLIMIIYLYVGPRVQYLDLSADKAVRHTVIVLIYPQADMPVLHHSSLVLLF